MPQVPWPEADSAATWESPCLFVVVLLLAEGEGAPFGGRRKIRSRKDALSTIRHRSRSGAQRQQAAAAKRGCSSSPPASVSRSCLSMSSNNSRERNNCSRASERSFGLEAQAQRIYELCLLNSSSINENDLKHMIYETKRMYDDFLNIPIAKMMDLICKSEPTSRGEKPEM
jgi:hypothetical protein